MTDTALQHGRDDDRLSGGDPRWGRRSLAAVAAVTAAVTALVVAALFHVEMRAPDYDPQYARDIVERTLRFGGSYYVNGIHNKGPLEPGVYHAVRLVTSFDGFWFGIAVVVIGAAVVAGLAARRVVTLLDGPAWLGWAALGVVAIHLTLSGADYAGVLYSRNMTVTLICGAFLLVTAPQHRWGAGVARTARAVVVGACLGLAVQTLVTALLSACVVGAYALAAVPAGRSVRRGPSDRAWLVIGAAVAFLSAPAWYAVIGPWRDFWDGWWVYGRYMSESTGRSLADQLGLGWNQFYAHGRTHAPALIGAALFVLLGVVRWDGLPRAARRLHVVLPVWWAAAWFEIILTQRYSTHYFVVTTVPMALMLVGLAWHLLDLLAATHARPLPPVAAASVVVALSLFWSGTGPTVEGLRRASRFAGVEALAHDRAVARDGTTRSVQAVLDLVSPTDGPMLTWTNYPWPFLQYRRVSATRFIWKSFLVGEIYLGRTSTDYVLPGSWDRWRDDIDTTDPQVFVTDDVTPVPGDTPAGRLLADEFVPLLTTPTQSVAVRPAVLAALLDRSSVEPFVADEVASGWSVSGSALAYRGSDDDERARLPLGDLRCRRWDAALDRGAIAFHVDDPVGRSESVSIVVEDDEAVSRSPDVEFLRLPAERDPGARVTLVVGTASALVMVDERAVAALTLLPGTAVTVSSVGDVLRLGDVAVGPAPTLGECAR